MKDYQVIEAFVSFLRDKNFPNLHIDRRPEEENRDSKDIDAIAGQFSIEHTFIPRFPNQKAQDDWFMKAMAGLEYEIPTPPYQLNISSGFYDIRKRQDWPAIRQAVKTWITLEATLLVDGEYYFDNIIGVPFPLRVEKLSNERPDIYFIRRLPENNNSLPSRIHEQCNLKIGKLVPYKKRGFTTVLLIEGLISSNRMRAAIREAFPDGLHPDLDEVWYVTTWENKARNFNKLF